MDDLATELARLAEAEAATPEGRARVVAALRHTLQTLEPVSFAPQPLAIDVAGRLDDLAGRLVMLGDEAEWLAGKLREVMPPAPTPTHDPGSDAGDTSPPA